MTTPLNDPELALKILGDPKKEEREEKRQREVREQLSVGKVPDEIREQFSDQLSDETVLDILRARSGMSEEEFRKSIHGTEPETTPEFEDFDQLRNFIEGKRDERLEARRAFGAQQEPVDEEARGQRLYLGLNAIPAESEEEEPQVEQFITTDDSGIPLYYDPALNNGRGGFTTDRRSTSRERMDQANIPAVHLMVGEADLEPEQIELGRALEAFGRVPEDRREELERLALETGVARSGEARQFVRDAQESELETRRRDIQRRFFERRRDNLERQLEEVEQQAAEELTGAEVDQNVIQEQFQLREDLENTNEFINRIEQEVARVTYKDALGQRQVTSLGDELSLWQEFEFWFEESFKRETISSLVERAPIVGVPLAAATSAVGPLSASAFHSLRNTNAQLTRLSGELLRGLSPEEVGSELQQMRREASEMEDQIAALEGRGQLRRRARLQEELRHLQTEITVRERYQRSLRTIEDATQRARKRWGELGSVWTYYTSALSPVYDNFVSSVAPVAEKLGIAEEDIRSFYEDTFDIDFDSKRNVLPDFLTEREGVNLSDEEIEAVITTPQFVDPSRRRTLGMPQAELQEKMARVADIRMEWANRADRRRGRAAQLLEAGQTEQARELVLDALALDRAASMYGDSNFAYTWVSHPEREELYYDALADAAIQKYAQTGEWLTDRDKFELKERFVDPWNELAGEVASDMALLLPEAAWEVVARGGIGAIKFGAKGILRGTGAALGEVPLLNLAPRAARYLFEQSHRSIARNLETRASDTFRLMARRGATQSLGDVNSMQNVMETAARYVAAEGDEAAAIADELPLIGQTHLEHLKKVSQIFTDIDMSRVHPRFQPIVESLQPENWARTIEELHARALEDARQRLFRKLRPEVEAGNKTQTWLRETVERNAREWADNPRHLDQYWSERINRAYQAVHAPVRAGSTLVLEDDAMNKILQGLHWVHGKIFGESAAETSTFLKEADNLVLNKTSTFFNNVRRTWTELVLSARVGWTMINLQDSQARMMLEGESIFDDWGTLFNMQYEEALQSGLVPEELMQTFMRGDLERAEEVGSRLLRGEKPTAGPLGFIEYEWKRLSREADLSDASLFGKVWDHIGRGYKSWIGGWHDTNSAIEFTLRLRLFGRKYASKFEMTEAVAFANWLDDLAARGLDADEQQFLIGLWRQTGDNPEQMRQVMQDMITKHVEQGNPLWSAFMPPDMNKALSGLSPLERANVVNSVKAHMKELVGRAAAEGRALEADEVNELFDMVKASIADELADASSDKGRHTIREIRETLTNDPDFDAQMPDPEDVESAGAMPDLRRGVEVEQAREAETAARELTPQQMIQTRNVEDVDQFLQNAADASDNFADFEVTDDIEGLAQTVFDNETGRARIRLSRELLEAEPDQVADVIRNQMQAVLERQDEILIDNAFDSTQRYRESLQRFLDDPDELANARPDDFEFIARQLEAAPSERKVLEGLSGKKLSGFLDPENTPLDDTTEAGRRVLGLGEEDIYGSWGQRVSPHPGFFRAGRRAKFARGKFTSMADRIRFAEDADVTADAAQIALRQTAQDIGRARDELFHWLIHDWPGPLQYEYGVGRRQRWLKTRQIQERLYNATANWFEELGERAANVESLEELRSLPDEISIGELLQRAGFRMDPDEARISIRNMPGHQGASTARATRGLIGQVTGANTWDDLFRPYHELIEENLHRHPDAHMEDQIRATMERISGREAEEIIEVQEGTVVRAAEAPKNTRTSGGLANLPSAASARLQSMYDIYIKNFGPSLIDDVEKLAAQRLTSRQMAEALVKQHGGEVNDWRDVVQAVRIEHGIPSAGPIHAGGGTIGSADDLDEAAIAFEQWLNNYNARQIEVQEGTVVRATEETVEQNEAVDSFTRSRLRQGFKNWGLEADQVDGLVSIIDGQARAWAQYTGRSKTEFYVRNYAGIVVGGEAAEGALFQRGRQTLEEFAQQYEMHYNDGMWVGGIDVQEGAQIGPVAPVGWATVPEDLADAGIIDLRGLLSPDRTYDGLFHVTTSRKGVLREGLKSADEIGRRALGGGGTSRVSITYSPRHAQRIEDRLRFVVRTARGETSVDEILRVAENDWYHGDMRPADVLRALNLSSIARDGSDVRSLFSDLSNKIQRSILEAGYDTGDPAAMRIVEDWLDEFITTDQEKFSLARHLDGSLVEAFEESFMIGTEPRFHPVGILSEFDDIRKVDPDDIETLRVAVNPDIDGIGPVHHFEREFELQFKSEDLWVQENPGSNIANPAAAIRYFRNAAKNGASVESVAANMDGDIRLIVNGLAALHDRPVREIVTEIMQGASPLAQRLGDDVLGSTEFLKDGRALVRGFAGADISTALHESSHVFVNALQRIADDAPMARRDLDVMEEFLEAEVGLTKVDGQWTEQMHEEIARRYERYFREGNAPTPALQGIFERFRQWMTDVYEKLRGSPLHGKKVEGTPLQEVFDRWTAQAAEPFEALDTPTKIQRIEESVVTGQIHQLPTNAQEAVRDQAQFMGKELGESQPGSRIWGTDPDTGKFTVVDEEPSTRPEWYRTLRYGTDHKLSPEMANQWAQLHGYLPEYKKGSLATDIANSIERMLAGEPAETVLDERVRRMVVLNLGNKTSDLTESAPNFAHILTVDGREAALREAAEWLEDTPSAQEVFDSPEAVLNELYGGRLDLAAADAGVPEVKRTVLEVPVTEMDDTRLAESVRLEARYMMDDLRKDRTALWREATQLDDETIVEQLDHIYNGTVPEDTEAYDRVRQLIQMNMDSGVMDLQTDEFIRAGHPHYHRLAGTPDDQIEDMVRMWDDMDHSPPSVEEYVSARARTDEFDNNAKEMWSTFVLAEGLDIWPDEVLSSPDRFRAFLTGKIDNMAEEGYNEFAPETMEAMDMLLQKVDDYLNLREDYGWAIGLEPSQIKARRAGRATVGLPEWNMPRPFRQWLRHTTSEQAKAERVLNAVEQWRQYLLGKIDDGTSVFDMREKPLERLETMQEAVEAGARMKDDAVDVAIHGDTGDELRFPSLAKGMQDQRFGHAGLPGALEETNWGMLDYSTYNHLDNVIRSYVPFWMFPSRSIPYWIEKTVMHPLLTAAYSKYQSFSRALAYQHGAVTSTGDQLPSLESYIPIPGTRMWFNPTAPISMRYVMELAAWGADEVRGVQPRYDVDEQDQEQKPLTSMVQSMMEGMRLFGIYMGPWADIPIRAAFPEATKGIPQFSLIPQTELIPSYWRRSLVDMAQRIPVFGPSIPDGNLSPDVRWKDYLIEREMLEIALQEIQSGNLSEDEKEALIQDVKAALGYRKVDDPNSIRRFELMPREDHELWLRARRQVEGRDLEVSWIGYFTGVYPKEHTDARAKLLELRDDINQLRDALNSEIGRDLFFPDMSAESLYDFYIDKRYETNEGWIRNLYGTISWTRTPGGEQAYSLQRRQIVAANLHQETMTDQYYATLFKYVRERDRQLQETPIGDTEARSQVWQKYFSNVERLENDPKYDAVNRAWVAGNKPDELILEDFRNKFYYLMRSTKPVYRPEQESFPDYRQRVEEWREELPTISKAWEQMYQTDLILDMMPERTRLVEVDGGYVYMSEDTGLPEWVARGASLIEDMPEEFPIDNSRMLRLQEWASRMTDEFDEEALDAWDKANDSPGDALNKAWEAMVWDPLWDIIGGDMNNFYSEVAQQEFLAQADQVSFSELANWVQEEYPGRWSRSELEQWARGGILEPSERIGPETELQEMEDDIWAGLTMIPPGEARDALNDELDQLMDFGSSRMTLWYENQSDSFKDEASFKEFYNNFMQALNNLDLEQPTQDELLEFGRAKELDDAFDQMVDERFGETFLRETMGPYWDLDPIFDQEERENMREADPRIELYNELNEQYAVDNPLWAKYFKPHLWEEIQAGELGEDSEGTVSGGSGRGSGGAGRGSTGTRTIRQPGSTSRGTVEPMYLPMGARGTRRPEFGQLGRGGVAGQPWWPAGLAETIGGIASTQIQALIDESQPLPTQTVEYLTRVAERHPEFEDWIQTILDTNDDLA